MDLPNIMIVIMGDAGDVFFFLFYRHGFFKHIYMILVCIRCYITRSYEKFQVDNRNMNLLKQKYLYCKTYLLLHVLYYVHWNQSTYSY